ncbi:DNA gyrase subunit A [Candidatus Woesearchaeota archaeon]|nr:DNA gyrase subunit A [Candidatus Woesearchaeota archaeon]
MPEKIQQKLIEEEMKESYIDYAMSVITARALPDVNDGLKPVHRRILYAMHKAGLQHSKPFRKSARVVGDVLGRYHPHGDMAVYDSLVRMAQDFSLRYPLVQGQGNFGSIDGYPAAAQRYTECKLTPIAEEMLEDIDKDTVKFVPNYDESYKEPIVLPGKIPNLLINGTTGIAVGMVSSIPPHNLREISDAIIALIDNPELKTDGLMHHVKGPDFPTHGIILGREGIRRAYKTGRGKLKVKAKCEFEKDKIVVSEIPYQVNKKMLIESIVELVKEKRIEGIKDIRDESDRKGMRIVLELKDNANNEVVLNQLYKHTQLQSTFSVIMTALVAGQPKTMSLRSMINFFIQHRKRVITRRTQFDLKKAEERVHILEGLKVALKNIDSVVKDIKGSKDVESAKLLLMRNYTLTEIQSQSILEMRLQRLTSLEQSKIEEEFKQLLDLIKELRDILASEERVLGIIKRETLELKQKYGDERRTVIVEEDASEIEDEDLIKNEEIIITATRDGYIKQTLLEEYRQQKRGGTGIIATEKKEEDIVEHLFSTKSHNHLLFFTNAGRVYWLKAYKIPKGSRYAKGKAIVNLFKLNEGEKVNAILPIASLERESYIMFATKSGKVKKTPLKSFSRPRKVGIKAVKLEEKDEVVSVKLTPGNLEIIVGSKKGNAVKFNETDVRVMGRNASGVRGIRLGDKDELIGMEIANPEATLLTVTEKGFGKRTDINEYRLTRRGGKGVRNIKITEKNGSVVGIKTVKDEDETMFITQNGVVIRTTVKGISKIGRNTQGVRLIKLREGDKVKTVTRIISRV